MSFPSWHVCACLCYSVSFIICKSIGGRVFTGALTPEENVFSYLINHCLCINPQGVLGESVPPFSLTGGHGRPSLVENLAGSQGLLKFKNETAMSYLKVSVQRRSPICFLWLLHPFFPLPLDVPWASAITLNTASIDEIFFLNPGPCSF